MLFLSHFHYVLVPGAVFSIIAAVYYWIPKWTGRMYNEKAGQWHFWLSAIFINLLFFPQHFAGLAGMQRRVPDYAVQFTDFNEASTIGAFGFFLAQRSEEHTSELQSLMRISYAVFCLKKKKQNNV